MFNSNESSSNYYNIKDDLDLADPDVAPIVERAAKLGFKLDAIKKVLNQTERNTDVDKIVDKLVEYDMKSLNDDQDDYDDILQQQQQQQQDNQFNFHHQTSLPFDTQFGQINLNENYDPTVYGKKQSNQNAKIRTKVGQNKKVTDEEAIYKEYTSKLNKPENLRHIIIDANDLAFDTTTNEYRFKRVLIAVNYFRKRLHKILVICPQWLRDRILKDPNAKEDQIALKELQQLEHQKQNICINYSHLNHDDDLMILHCAMELDGIIISNDLFKRHFTREEKFRKVINERLLKCYYVKMDPEETFSPTQDPLGKKIPTLDNFLRKVHIKEICPYKERCTYGFKCSFFHAERDYQYENYKGAYSTMLAVSEEEQKRFASLKEKREKMIKNTEINKTQPQKQPQAIRSPMVPPPIRGPVLPSPPAYGQSNLMPKIGENNYFSLQISNTMPYNFELNARGPINSSIWQTTSPNSTTIQTAEQQWSFRNQQSFSKPTENEYSLFPQSDIRAQAFEPKPQLDLQPQQVKSTKDDFIKALIKRGIQESTAIKTVEEYPDIDNIDHLHDIAVDFEASNT